MCWKETEKQELKKEGYLGVLSALHFFLLILRKYILGLMELFCGKETKMNSA